MAEPIFKADGTDEEQAPKITLMQVIYADAQKYAEDDPDIPHDICGWPISIHTMELKAGQLTVSWNEGLALSCFHAAFNKAWAKHGDGSEVVHIDLDDTPYPESDVNAEGNHAS